MLVLIPCLLFLIVLGIIAIFGKTHKTIHKTTESTNWRNEAKQVTEWDETEGTDLGWWVLGLGITTIAIFIVASLLPTALAFSDQLNDNGRIRQTKRVQVILDRKADDLIEQFTTLLAVEYPQYESGIYDKITSLKEVQLLMVKFPELKTAAGVKNLVKRINDLRSDVIQQAVKRQNLLRKAEVRKENPWFITPLLPDPERVT